MPKPQRGPKGQKINGVIEFSPDGPIEAWGGTFMVQGFGYPADSQLHVGVADPGCCLGFNVMTDELGQFTILWVAGSPGTYRFTAFGPAGERTRGGKYEYYGFGEIDVIE